MHDWTFDDLDFDTHVREQLPWYDLATECVSFLAKQYIPTSNGLVYDIGASTGNMSKAIQQTLVARNALCISIEPNQSMIQKFNGYGEVVEKNAQDFVYDNYDVAILFLTVMFIPVSERDLLFKKLKRKLKKGGAIIVVDKVNDASGYFSTCLKRLTLHFKNKVKKKDIINKELSLSGVQRPSKRNGKLFFKVGEFEGWIIEG
jgi:tRNA (cmo5U34)-methyltransferase